MLQCMYSLYSFTKKFDNIFRFTDTVYGCDLVTYTEYAVCLCFWRKPYYINNYVWNIAVWEFRSYKKFDRPNALDHSFELIIYNTGLLLPVTWNCLSIPLQNKSSLSLILSGLLESIFKSIVCECNWNWRTDSGSLDVHRLTGMMFYNFNLSVLILWLWAVGWDWWLIYLIELELFFCFYFFLFVLVCHRSSHCQHKALKKITQN